MSEDAHTKAKRRRRMRECFPPPLNQVALRHVDSVQALGDIHRDLLANVLASVGLGCVSDCLATIKKYRSEIEEQADLLRFLGISSTPQVITRAIFTEPSDSSPQDKNCLTALLIRCYSDMPQSSTEALISSEVMCAVLQVVATTRDALQDAKSDFVITALYTLFEDRLNAIAHIIKSNPAFFKAIQSSRPD